MATKNLERAAEEIARHAQHVCVRYGATRLVVVVRRDDDLAIASSESSAAPDLAAALEVAGKARASYKPSAWALCPHDVLLRDCGECLRSDPNAVRDLIVTARDLARERDALQMALRTCARMARLRPGSELSVAVIAEAERVLGKDGA